ncbi:MAG: M48 family metalloprotease [Sideroxydans sp.]
MKRLAWKLTLLLSALTFTGCAQNPVSGRQDFVMMSEAQEIALGRQSDVEVRKQYRVYDDPALQAYVNRVGQAVAIHSHRPQLTYHFTVVDSPEINAFALPGGYIYITRGIMAYLNSEAELAAVLGHEIGHVTARHGVRQQSAAQATGLGITLASIFVPELASQAGQDMANLLGGALLAGYGREHELESDRLGAQYLARSGYDPQAMIRVIGTLKNQELFDAEIARQEGREPRRYHGTFATHPDNDTRLQQVVGEAAQLKVETANEGREEYLKQIAHLVFNDSVEEGVVRGNRFLHKDLGIALDFPPQWSIKNSSTQLLALNPAGDTLLELKVDAKPVGTVVEYARRIVGNAATVESLQIGQRPAAIASHNALMLGVIYHEGKAFLLLGRAKSPQALAAQRNALLDSIKSFRPLSAAERAAIRPLRLQLRIVQKGDTWNKLAQESPLGRNAERYLRLINGQYPQGEPLAGQTIKIVE